MWLYQVLLGFTRFLLGSIQFNWFLQSLKRFHLVSLGFTVFYQVLLGFTGLYWVVLGCTGLYWVLLGFTGFKGCRLRRVIFHFISRFFNDDRRVFIFVLPKRDYFWSEPTFYCLSVCWVSFFLFFFCRICFGFSVLLCCFPFLFCRTDGDPFSSRSAFVFFLFFFRLRYEFLDQK